MNPCLVHRLGRALSLGLLLGALIVPYQAFLRASDGTNTLMSGKGSPTFAIVLSRAAAERLRERNCGPSARTAVAGL